jgi:hypothetical protein
MAIVVIGGQSKDIGKTSVVCALIEAMPERRWTAIKISRHGADLAHDHLGDCETDAIAVIEERDSTRNTDSSRYLAAGATRAFWVRTGAAPMAEVMPRIRAAMDGAENVILESNSVVGWLQPDLYATVLNPAIADFKASASLYLDRADAILLCGEGMMERPDWSGVSAKVMERTPKFRFAWPDSCSAEFLTFVAEKLERVER